MSKIQKSTLTAIAKLIQKFDADLFGLAQDNPEAMKIRAARTALVDLIFETGHELTLDYKVIKSETKRTVNDF